MLTAQKIDHFETFGFLLFRQLFSPAEMAEMTAEAEEVWREDLAHQPGQGHQQVAPFLERRPLLARLPEDDRIYLPVQQLLGLGFVWGGSEGNKGSFNVTRNHPWHSDRADQIALQYTRIKIMIYLQAVTKDTGALEENVASPFVHSGLTNGMTFYYVVTAVISGTETVESAEVSATPIDPPSFPRNVMASAGNMQVTLQWDPSAGTDSYNVYWGTSPGVTVATGMLIAGVTSPFTHSPLMNGTTYYYVVTAVNAGGESPESAGVFATSIAPPAAPGSVAASPGNMMNTINWNDSPGAISHNLYWSTTPGVTQLTGMQILGVMSPHPHGSLMNGTTYYYVVTAVNAGGESPDSAQVSATPIDPPATFPANLDASPGNAEVDVSWDVDSNAVSYLLYWNDTGAAVTSSDNPTPVAGTTFNHPSLVNDRLYSYRATWPAA